MQAFFKYVYFVNILTVAFLGRYKTRALFRARVKLFGLFDFVDFFRLFLDFFIR